MEIKYLKNNGRKKEKRKKKSRPCQKCAHYLYVFCLFCFVFDFVSTKMYLLRVSVPRGAAMFLNSLFTRNEPIKVSL